MTRDFFSSIFHTTTYEKAGYRLRKKNRRKGISRFIKPKQHIYHNEIYLLLFLFLTERKDKLLIT